MKPIIIIMALLNLMISCNYQILPVFSVDSGPLISTLIIILTGFLSFYSCYLYLEHLGNYDDMDQAIQYHFWDSKIAKAIYNFITFAFFLAYLNTYYGLIIQYWDLIFPDQNSVLNPIFNAIGLFVIICALKYLNYATKVLAYGAIFIIISTLLLIWVFFQEHEGPKRPPVIGTGIPQITAFMGVAYQVQQILIPMLRYLPKKYARNIKQYTLTTYVIAGLIYLFSAFVGCFGLINRSQSYPLPLTIFSYFPPEIWQAKLFQTLSVIILYFSFPEIVLICKKRFFAFLNAFFTIKNTNRYEFFTKPELAFVFLLMGLYLGLQLGSVQVLLLIPFNVVLTFIYFYLVPATLQFKCLYFARPKAVFNIVFSDKNTENRINKTNMEQNSSDPIFSINSVPLTQKTYKTYYGNQGLSKKSIDQDKNEQNNYELQIQEQQDDKKTEDNTKKIKQVLIQPDKQSGPDSLVNQRKQLISIETLNEVCPAKLPVGWWKVLDITTIFAMLALGMYVMIYNLINFHLPS